MQGEADATAGRDDAHVRAMTVVPGQKGSAGIEEVPDPDMQDGALLVRGMAIGICGTDREIAEGGYGTPPSGEARLIIGHESLGEVLEAPAGSGFAPGDLVVGIVRRPDVIWSRTSAPDTIPATPRTSTSTSTWSSSAPGSARSAAPPAANWPAAGSCA
jgi:NADPH:quinone reductase-like Zn-dependent oxidoreductase